MRVHREIPARQLGKMPHDLHLGQFRQFRRFCAPQARIKIRAADTFQRRQAYRPPTRPAFFIYELHMLSAF